MTQRGQKHHEWTIVAQQHSPNYREFYHCDLCDQYEDDLGNRYTRTQFKIMAGANVLYEPDSDIMITFPKDQTYIATWSRYNAKSMCSCGHTGDGGYSQHQDNLELGHGACTAPGCHCVRFTWVGWTLKAKAQLGLK